MAVCTLTAGVWDHTLSCTSSPPLLQCLFVSAPTPTLPGLTLAWLPPTPTHLCWPELVHHRLQQIRSTPCEERGKRADKTGAWHGCG